MRRANAAGASVTARKALGFEELLAGDVEAMKRRTRNYARRQLTWMRKLAGVNVIDTTGRAAADVAAEVLALWHGAHGSGVNGYITTTATSSATPQAATSRPSGRHRAISATPRRRSPASRSPCSTGSWCGCRSR